MFRSAVAISLLVFSLSMIVAVAILPQPPAEHSAEGRSAAETIEDTAARQ